MGYHNVGNTQYQQEQITKLLYFYMVQGASAKDAMINALFMSATEIGDGRQAWRKIEHIYRSFGFSKRYMLGSGTAYQNIQYQKLYSYVQTFWNKNATEKDLLNFFPEIAQDLAAAKQADKNKPQGSWGSSGSSRKQYDPNAPYQAKRYNIPEANGYVEEPYEEPGYEEPEEYEENEYYEKSYSSPKFNADKFARGIERGVDSLSDVMSNGSKKTVYRRGPGGNAYGRANKKNIIIILVAIIAFIFRKQLWAIFTEFLPLIVLAGIGFVVYRWIKSGGLHGAGKARSRNASKGSSAPQVRFDAQGLIPAAILWIIGFGGFKNGAGNSLGSTILGLALIAIGVACVFRRK